MTPQEALSQVRSRFPFPGYNVENDASYLTVGKIVEKYVPAGGRVYDFGSGPCDKTAIAAAMGYDCTAYDDLGDNWHKEGDKRDRILAFAEEFGIRFRETFAPSTDGPFDMVMMNDVLEHLHESPRPLLTELVSSLKPGGILFASVPNLANLRKRLSLLRGRTNLPSFDLYFSWDGFWRGPVREYVRGDLTTMTRRMGLELVELSTAHHMLKNLKSSPTRAAYLAVTRLFPDLADTWVLVVRRPANWTPEHVA